MMEKGPFITTVFYSHEANSNAILSFDVFHGIVSQFGVNGVGDVNGKHFFRNAAFPFAGCE